LLKAEHMRREQPSPENEEALRNWSLRRQAVVEELLACLKVQASDDPSLPHPLISILQPIKGKKMIPRVLRQLEPSQQLDMLLIILKHFSQLDVVANAYLMDRLEDSPSREQLELHTQAFMDNVFNGFLPLLMELSLPPINHIFVALTQGGPSILISWPGVAFLTALLSQVANIIHAANESESAAGISPDDLNEWQHMFDRWFHELAPHFMMLFPSTRIALGLPFGTGHHMKPSPLTDTLDQPVWNFFATFAVHASSEQQHMLVSSLREKVLEAVTSVSNDWDSEESVRRIANVNMFLNVLGLDSSQIPM